MNAPPPRLPAPAALPDLQAYVERAAREGELVVQPRMGMAGVEAMRSGLRAVATAQARTVGTLTIDSYTRVGDHAAARRALAAGHELNGFPLVAHGGPATAAMLAGAPLGIPVQVRHGSAAPREIFRTAVRAGLTASEGGPVSYCLPYGRVPLAESVRNWDAATAELADGARRIGARAHLETFGGCLLGQLCPPSLLIAVSALEALYFARLGIPTVSLSYAQQTDPVQDLEALAALRLLAAELLPPEVERHLVLYTYMGVYPGTPEGARALLEASAELAVRGGAERLIAKTVAEAVRIPTVAENVSALELAARTARRAARRRDALPDASRVDCSQVLEEARALVAAVLDGPEDIGRALQRAFATGVLDVPFCLHRDNAGLTRGRIADNGRLEWADTGRLPLPGGRRTGRPVRSHQLIDMLWHTATGWDRAALERAAAEAELESALMPATDRGLDRPALAPYRIAVVGSGPRGLAVLERLAARLAAEPPAQPVEIHLYDPVQIGCGRIWRTDQPSWYLMNTVAGEVTMFSGPADAGPARPGAGPTLAQWWASVDPDCPGPDGYAPRPLYGRYLSYLCDTAEAALPPGTTLHRHPVEVLDLRPRAGRYLLECADGSRLTADRVVLTTGHPRPDLDPAQQRLADFAAQHPDAHYVPGDSASDMPLDDLRAGSTVGVLGLGLSFYDVLVALTIGRGGTFAELPGGALEYRPSGREPLLVAGSRSGVPIPARGRNQKSSDHTYRPRLLTADRIADLRRRRRLDFRRDVLPLLLGEMELVYYGTAVRARFGADTAERFVQQALAACSDRAPGRAIRLLAAHFGAGALPPLDLDALTRPFAGRTFADPDEYHRALFDVLDEDLRHARLGNLHGPLKASFDVLRDTRGILRTAVDFSGLTPDSHRKDFLAWFTPVSSFLAAGPPLDRLRQTRALLDAGVLRVVGPSVCFDTDPAAGRFTVHSAQVGGDPVPLDALVDARIPTPDLHRDRAPLVSRLREAGLWSGYRNTDGSEEFDTGGVAVTGAPYHPIRADGQAERGLYVLGIPTEHTRWFTQVGSGRPGAWPEFTRDADAIAADLQAGAAALAPRPTAPAGGTR
ncbi:FAD/NAD(P)-binding protein [Kitasatospora sp. NPDC004531]